MKKHNVVRFGYVAVTVFVVTLLVTGCKNPTGADADNKNFLTVDGQTYALSELYFIDYWDGGIGYNINISITGPDLESVYLWTYFSGSSVSSGTYSYSNSTNAGTFCGESNLGTASDSYYITAGEVDISISGSTYTIDGDVTVSGGLRATFNYTGPLTGYYD